VTLYRSLTGLRERVEAGKCGWLDFEASIEMIRTCGKGEWGGEHKRVEIY
jgi:hypothetical protein